MIERDQGGQNTNFEGCKKWTEQTLPCSSSYRSTHSPLPPATMPASANTPSACLANFFGQHLATQLVASRGEGSPTSLPRAKLARPAPNDTATGLRNTRRRACGSDGTANAQPFKPKELFQSGAGDPSCHRRRQGDGRGDGLALPPMQAERGQVRRRGRVHPGLQHLHGHQAAQVPRVRQHDQGGP